MTSVTVCVCTFGDEGWIALAERAIASAEHQATVIHVHADTLANARNTALAQVTTDMVVFLDADDELEPGYITALMAGSADLRAPAVRYVRGARSHPPYVPRVAGHDHDCNRECLPYGNYLVVGALARTEIVRAAGGWGDEELYEDWALWLRCYVAGATVESIPTAIYRAHVRADSRNRAPTMAEKNRVHHQIVKSILGDRVAA
jgi:glycosyltransferase involved in cell wall biosynthesis